ncbi:MAG: tetratricopeptide repeat protein [Lachnospiraceae bacterium]|nr:tetratricopeptide repeat protein [Lachnospiraceae bacterium]
MKTEMERLKRFLKGYESEPEPQEIDKISGDFQLAGLKPLIDHIIREKKIKKVIDLGCGNAILLKCLMKDIGIQYLGVDTKDAIKGAFSTILELDVSEYAKLKPLDKFQFEQELSDGNTLIVYRNVFHELSMEQTAEIIWNLSKYMRSEDFLLVQDMTNLPVAENVNVGWQAENFKNVFSKIGFDVHIHQDTSRGGTVVFLLEAYKNGSAKKISQIKILDIIKKQRSLQLKELKEVRNTIQKDNDKKVVIARLNHDIWALSQQLEENGDDINKAAAELVQLALMVSVQNDSFNERKYEFNYSNIDWFQNRGKPLQMFDQFLCSEKIQILQVSGAQLIGKTTLIWRALSKLNHDRLPIKIRVTEGIGILSIFEQLVLGLGCSRFMDSELLSRGVIDKPQLFEILESRELLSRIVENVILVFDNIQSICNFESQIENEEFKTFMTLWSNNVGAKIILETVSEIQNLSDEAENVMSVRLTKFKSIDNEYGEYTYSVHMLQELVPMQYRLKDKGIGGFPEKLIRGIDNHPYLTYITAKMITNNSNRECLKDDNFIQLLESNIMSEIIKKFKISDRELELMNILLIDGEYFSEDFLDKLERYQVEIISLKRKGILYQEAEKEYRLTNIIFVAQNKAEYFDFSDDNKMEIQNQLYNIYRELAIVKSNPNFLRKKLYYAYIVGKQKEVTSYALDQAYELAENLFCEHKYELAAGYYEQIEKYMILSDKAKMRKASALIRSGDIKSGSYLFEKLIDKNRGWVGLKNSYVDALLYLKSKEYSEKSISVLKTIPESHRNAYWYEQFGRANRILLNISEVFEAYDQYIVLENDTEKVVRRILDVINFAEDLCENSQIEGYLRILENSPYVNYVEAQTELGSYYFKQGNYKKAMDFLSKAYDRRPKNQYCILPLVKAYCDRGQYSDAEEILNRVSLDKIICNNLLIQYAKIYMKQSKCEFEEGEKLLFEYVKKNDENIHTMTQWMEFYFNYYKHKGDRSALEKAAKYKKEIMKSNNIPSLLLLNNICNELGNKKLAEEIMQIVAKLNPNAAGVI